MNIMTEYKITGGLKLFVYYLFVGTIVILTNFTLTVNCGNLVKRSLKDTVKCFEGAKFYRNPDRPAKKIWTNSECSKYYLCLDGEVFEFKCSVGLLFDVSRQICDFKQNVDNCDVTAESPCYPWKNEIQVPEAAGCQKSCVDVIKGPQVHCLSAILNGCECIHGYVRGPCGFCIPESACASFYTHRDSVM